MHYGRIESDKMKINWLQKSPDHKHTYLCCHQALTGSDFQLRVGSGRVVSLKVGLSGTLGSGSDKFSEVD